MEETIIACKPLGHRILAKLTTLLCKQRTPLPRGEALRHWLRGEPQSIFGKPVPVQKYTNGELVSENNSNQYNQ